LSFTVSEAAQAKIKKLVEECKKHSGEYIAKGNPPWATTYSEAFSEAATEICRIYILEGYRDPAFALYRLFKTEGVQSCRMTSFDYDRTEYFFNRHVAWRLRGDACQPPFP